MVHRLWLVLRLSILVLGLALPNLGCGGGSAGKLMVDSPAYPFEPPEVDEDEDEEEDEDEAKAGGSTKAKE